MGNVLEVFSHNAFDAYFHYQHTHSSLRCFLSLQSARQWFPTQFVFNYLWPLAWWSLPLVDSLSLSLASINVCMLSITIKPKTNVYKTEIERRNENQSTDGSKASRPKRSNLWALLFHLHFEYWVRSEEKKRTQKEGREQNNEKSERASGGKKSPSKKILLNVLNTLKTNLIKLAHDGRVSVAGLTLRSSDREFLRSRSLAHPPCILSSSKRGLRSSSCLFDFFSGVVDFFSAQLNLISCSMR